MKKIESESEVLLFTGVCYNCGKSGHCANDCKKKNDGQGTKKAMFLGKCNNCGLRGHTGKDFWEKEDNKNKRPEIWKKKYNRSPEEDITIVMGNGNEEKVTTTRTVKGNVIKKMESSKVQLIYLVLCI
jgi:hypothetical protein